MNHHRQTVELIQQLREEIRRREIAPLADRAILASGFAPLDNLLPGGGFPSGRVVELTGTRASGKTTLALLALAQATRAGRFSAFIDASQELYPPAAQALGIDLSRLLVVRPQAEPSQLLQGGLTDDGQHHHHHRQSDGSSGSSVFSLSLRAAGLLARSQAFAAVVVDTPVTGGSLGVNSRRLLDAAETGRAAMILLCDTPSGLDVSLRLSVERTTETEILLCLSRSRLGPSGRTARGNPYRSEEMFINREEISLKVIND